MQNKKQFDELWQKTKEKTDLTLVEFTILYLASVEGKLEREIGDEFNMSRPAVSKLLKKYHLSPGNSPKTVRYSPKHDKSVVFKF